MKLEVKAGFDAKMSRHVCSRRVQVLSQTGWKEVWLVQTDHSQGFTDFSAAVLKCRGDVFHIRQTKQTHYDVAQRCHNLWCAILANLGVVFVKRSVTHVMNFVFD